MNKNEIIELMHLFCADELSDENKSELEKLIESSPEYKSEFEKIQKFYSTVAENKPVRISEEMLTQSRRELLRNIRKERFKPSLVDRLNEWLLGAAFSGYKFAAGTASALVVGILLGYFVFRPTLQATVDNNNNEVMSIDQVLSSSANIDNIRLTESSPLEGKITITFEAAKPYKYTGSIEDKSAQLLLANMMTKSENPGQRIKSVKKLAETVDGKLIPDLEVKKALISSLKNDNNAGVRRTALDVLKKYPYDDQIRDAILHTLSNDQNSGIRVAAINALAELKLEGVKFDSTVKNELTSKVKNEPNLFIKNLAESLLKGDDL